MSFAYVQDLQKKTFPITTTTTILNCSNFRIFLGGAHVPTTNNSKFIYNAFFYAEIEHIKKGSFKKGKKNVNFHNFHSPKL